MKPTLFIASDHAGFELKSYLLKNLPAPILQHWNLEDLGPLNADRVDYPDFAKTLCKKLLERRSTENSPNINSATPSAPSSQSFGILICGSGQGMAMTANRVPGIRAALAWNEDSAKLSREHNDANVLCLGARLIENHLAVSLIEIFLKTAFEGGRHSGRISKIERT